MDNNVESYYAVKTIYGVISNMGSKELKQQPRIQLDGVDYYIYITEEQDRILKEFYREPDKRLMFKVKQKISVSTKSVISARLLGFEYSGKDSFLSNLSKLDPDDFSSINFKNNDDILKP